jgi:hypothetical protein
MACFCSIAGYMYTRGLSVLISAMLVVGYELLDCHHYKEAGKYIC